MAMFRPCHTWSIPAAALISALVICAQDPPKLRLDGNFRPKEYAATLRLSPEEEQLTGSIEISVESREPAKVIWLNAAPTVKIEQATLDGRAGKILRGGEQFTGISFETPVPAGKLRIRYTAAVSSKQSEGPFRVKDLDRWYLYTQFEPISARKVFPCFDEPNYKVPWQLTLEVPKQHSAFSNTPPVSEKTEGATKTITFAKTRPLPSYLVAFA